MKVIVIVILISTSFVAKGLLAQTNPTGTYVRGDGLKHGDTGKKGYFGEIRVKHIGNNKIAVAFYVNSGKPAYNSGSFVDTLTYNNGKATYALSKFDSSCRIHFTFSTSRLLIRQISKVYPSPCGFGWDVIATGSYKKRSSRLPEIVDISKLE